MKRHKGVQALKSMLAAVMTLLAMAVGMTLTAAPALAYATSDIATTAETHTLGSWGGQCKAFVNGVVAGATGVSLSGYQQGFANAGAVEVTNHNDAVRGDIIQITPAGSTDATAETLYNPSVSSRQLHTTIIRGPRNSDGSFNVIDSNGDGHNDELITEHALNPDASWAAGSIVKIWRFGTAGGGGTNNPRVIALDSSSTLSVKEGPINATWIPINQGVVDYRASSNRIATLMSDGSLWVKEGPINAVWQQVATGVSPGHFAVTNDMVAVLWGTDLYAKVGSLGATWGLILNPVSSFKVSASDHVAALMTSGDLNVQWGPVGAGWVDVASAISGYDITDDMVGVNWGGNLLIKQGGVGVTWGVIMNPVTDFAISPGDHIAANMTSGALNVLWGPIGSSWTGVASGYNSYAITDNRVGILQNGTLSVKEGSAGALWTQVATGITSFTLT